MSTSRILICVTAVAMYSPALSRVARAVEVSVDFSNPAGGWTYAYTGDEVLTPSFNALDGTWGHFLSDKWDGSAPGELSDPATDPGGDSPGGVVALDEGGINYVRMQDAGFPSQYDDDLFIPGNENWLDGGSNRKIYFGHNIESDGNAGANGASVLNDGMTLSFRARIASTGILDQVYIEGGGGTAPWPAEGKGYALGTDARGMFGVEQAGIQALGFSLGLASETPVGIGGGLIMNNSSPAVSTASATPETANVVEVSDTDLLDWNEFWITIEENDAATWKVDVYLNGSTTPETFVAHKQNSSEYPVSTLVMGLSSGSNFGAFDADFFAYTLGVVTPASADFDGDGDVDGLDLFQWEGDFGQNGDSDADADNDSDGADFLVWQRQFDDGTTTLAIPEPSSALIASCLLLALGLLGRRFGTRDVASRFPRSQQKVAHA